MTASRPEGAKGLVEKWAGGPVHEATDGTAPRGTNGALVYLIAEYARGQATCKAHAFRGPPATCCYVGDTISFWDDKFVTAVNEDEKVIDDLRAQLQTLRGENEDLQIIVRSGADAITRQIAFASSLTQEKAALEARERALREALEKVTTTPAIWTGHPTGCPCAVHAALAPRPRHEQGIDMTENIERKFTFIATSVEHGRQHTEADAMIFLAKDRALPATLKFYLAECERIGCKPRQLLGISLLIERVERWQLEHPGALKVADVDPTPAGDTVVRPNES